MRFTSIFLVLVTSALVMFEPRAGAAGDVVISDAYASYFQRGNVTFDPVQQVLIAFRRPHDRSDPPVAWVDAEGRHGGVANPLSEYPDADEFDIWAVAAGPQGILVSGVVQAGEKALRLPPRHVILTYDLAGGLRGKWAMNPWHVHEMAVDRGGNVYALGERIDRHSANLMRKYSRDGVLKREFMPAAMFPRGELAVSPDRGSNQLWIEGERLCAYMADIDELLEFDLEGKLQRRWSLEKALTRLARDHGGVRADVVNLAAESERASLMAQVRIWGEGQKSVSLLLARLPLDGSRPQSLESADGTALGTSDFPLLGRSGNETLFLNRYTATILRR
jgi:hypothetical protein